MPTQSIRIAHTSDVHIDGTGRSQNFEGFKNVAEYSFSRVVDGVIEERCDLFLIVGDLFDNARVPDSDFEFVRTQLKRLDIPVILIPGNHDLHDEKSLWTKFDWSSLNSNIHPIKAVNGETIYLSELNVRLWGRAMTDHAPGKSTVVRASRARRPCVEYWLSARSSGRYTEQFRIFDDYQGRNRCERF